MASNRRMGRVKGSVGHLDRSLSVEDVRQVSVASGAGGNTSVEGAGPQTASAGVSRNILANLIGNGWTALLALAMVPLYVHLLGLQQYGIVGFYTALQTLVVLLDLGISTTLNRTLARLSAYPDSGQQMRDVVRTLEMPYWAAAGLICVPMAAASPLIADGWFRSHHISTATLQQALLLMGFAMALQFPFALYSGGLLGLRRQVLLNVIMVAVGTLRAIGAVAILGLVSPTIQAFLIWQVVTSLLLSALTGVALWRSLPHSTLQPAFRREILRTSAGFALRIFAMSVLALIVVQGPRLEVSRLVSLKEFGYFTIATVLVSGLGLVVVPVYSAVFPRLTQLAELTQQQVMARLYHDGAQMVSALVLPAACTLVVYAPQVLYVWTGRSGVAAGAGTPLAFLAAGSAVNAMMYIPQALQLAHGWTRLTIGLGTAMVAIALPCTFILTERYGISGAAFTWLATNAAALPVDLWLTHRRFLPGHLIRWFRVDVLPTTAVSTGVALLFRLALPGSPNRYLALAELAACLAGVSLAAALVTPRTRGPVISLLRARVPAFS